jgi:Cu(I)/Ag(I) efflux system membrane protein CusA/SilA
VAGTDLKEIDRITSEIERAVKKRTWRQQRAGRAADGGALFDVTIDRTPRALRPEHSPDVQSVVASAIGGDNVGESSSKACSASPSMCTLASYCDSVDAPAVLSGAGAHSRAVEHGRHHLSDGPPMLRSKTPGCPAGVRRHPRARPGSLPWDMQQAVAQQVS